MPVDDLWYLNKRGPNNKRLRSKRHGKGKRWRVRYQDTNGAQRTKFFDREVDATAHTEILAAHRLLLDYGVETQTADVLDRLDAITAEAHELACRLAALGQHDAAANSATGWPIIHRPKESRS
jgi:hypothetical protein